MSKKGNEENPLNQFNILDTPFGEGGLEIEFKDDFKEDISVKNTIVPGVEDHEEIDETNTGEFKEKTEEPKKAESKTKKAEKEAEEEFKEEVEDVKSKKASEEIQEETSTLKTFASWLGEQGLVDYDEESFEDSEEGLKKLMSSTVEREVENYKRSLPEEVHKLVEFVEAGGNPKQFLDAYYNTTSWNEFEIEDENDAKTVLKEYLKAQGEDDDDINETIDTYEVSGILEKKAKTYLNKLQQAEKSYQEQLVEQQKRYDAEQRALAKKQYEEFKESLYKKDEIQGFKLTPKMKDNLWNFIMKPDKEGKTGLQKHNETNQDAQFLYAYLAMNNWDLSKLETQVKSKVHSELASKLSNFKDSRSKMKSGQSDSFGDQKANNFSAFKQALNNGMI